MSKTDKIIQKEVYGTASRRKLFDLFSKLLNDKRAIEHLIILLESEKNRRKMIQFLENGCTDLDEITNYLAELG